MTIRHLRIFLEVADCGKMSLAAQRLYVSQPTVSQAIAELETECGVRLFKRLSRKLHITPEGGLLLGYAQRIVSLFDEMEVRLSDARQTVRLRIGATITVGTCVIADIVAILARRFPKIDTEVLVANTRTVEERILSSALDVGIVEGQVHSPDLIREPIAEDRLVLVCGAGHPLAAAGAVRLEALRDEAFILREQGSGTRELLEGMARQQGFAPRCKWECNNTEAIKNAVAADLGLTLISERLVRQEVESGRLHIIELRDSRLLRPLNLVYHKNEYLTDFFREFLEVCREYGRVRPLPAAP